MRILEDLSKKVHVGTCLLGYTSVPRMLLCEFVCVCVCAHTYACVRMRVSACVQNVIECVCECNLYQQEEEDKALRTARRERAKADAEWMKKVNYEPFCTFSTNVTSQ